MASDQKVDAWVERSDGRGKGQPAEVDAIPGKDVKRFPEYGNQLYRPDAGAALVFSCAHLHEVLNVTAGRRFVLLSFLYGEPFS